MVLVAYVSSYGELRFAQKRNLESFYFRDVMQFHILEPAFLTLLKCAMDEVLVEDGSSYHELSFRLKRYLVGFYFCDVMRFPIL